MEPKGFMWSILFKKKKGPLKWVDINTQDAHEAYKQAIEVMYSRYPNEGYRYYGSSKTFLYSCKILGGKKYFCEDGDKLLPL